VPVMFEALLSEVVVPLVVEVVVVVLDPFKSIQLVLKADVVATLDVLSVVFVELSDEFKVDEVPMTVVVVSAVVVGKDVVLANVEVFVDTFAIVVVVKVLVVLVVVVVLFETNVALCVVVFANANVE